MRCLVGCCQCGNDEKLVGTAVLIMRTNDNNINDTTKLIKTKTDFVDLKNLYKKCVKYGPEQPF